MNKKQFATVIGFLSMLMMMIILIYSPSSFAVTELGSAVPTTVTASNIEDQKAADKIGPMTYGMSDPIILQIPAAAFVSADPGTEMVEDAWGYVSVTGGGRLFAPVNLPNGAEIRWLDLYYHDTNVSDDLEATLFEFTGTTTPAVDEIASVYSTGSSGKGYSAYFLSPNFVTVDNDNQYMVYIYSSNDTTERFKAVNIWYRLQISPAPATATFSDVPTSHQYFQYIEALADSGITTGYDDGTFRPGSYVTRGQMATFLSRALGLHWPN